MNEPLVVLQSFPKPRPTTNPYVVMLGDSLNALEDVGVLNFSWRNALLGRYDVVHLHWPEIMVSGQGPAKKVVRQLLFVAFLAKLRLQRIPIVRTVHNLELPSGISRREVVLLKAAERQTALWIKVNTTTELPADQPQELIVHGHYRDWYARYARSRMVSGRVAFFGMIRRYKGVDALLRAFTETADSGEELSLHVAGRPSSEELAAELTALATPDDRIRLRLEFLTDAQLVDEVSQAQLIVLPYPDMHNSGGTLAALSLNRPVLVSDNEVNRRLAEEVGPGWVFRYQGSLDAGDIVSALKALPGNNAGTEPDLSARNWDLAGRDHRTAYRRAIDLERQVSRVGALFNRR